MPPLSTVPAIRQLSAVPSRSSPNGRAPEVGEVFVQTDLAWTLEQMIAAEAAADGDRRAGLAAARSAFYEGRIADRIVAFHAANGGLLTADDLATYKGGDEPTHAVGRQLRRVVVATAGHV